MRAMKTIVSAALFCLLAGVVCAQEKAVPVGEEGHHQVVLENEYTRVFHVVLAPRESTLMHQHDRDYVYVMIGSSQVGVVKPGAAPTQMKLNDGDVKFTKGPLTHKVTNTGETPFVNLTIEVKKSSAKAVCGASWAGVEATGKCFDRCAGNSCESQMLVTDAVQANIHDAPSGGSVGIGPKPKPSLIVPLQEVEVTNGSKIVKLQAGEVTWIPANANAKVTSTVSAGRSHWVVVSFE
jgi:mannose-6-phosphate isomerase-like protein (cupin superfamily)